MHKVFEEIDIIYQDGQKAELLQADRGENEITIYRFHLSWSSSNAEQDDEFIFEWTCPIKDGLYRWTPICHQNRFLPPAWTGYEISMISRGAPICSHYDGNGMNHYTWGLSECSKTIFYRSGVIEQNGRLQNCFKIPVKQYTNQFETDVLIYIDTRRIPFGKSIADIACWWDRSIGMKPIIASDAAYEPVYSFWYSYHQDISEEIVEKECRRAKELGFDICIVDDGWQTDNNCGGYAYCGDWIPSAQKFPNMRQHVQRVHDMGMKYMLWFSVPFLGEFAENYAEYKDMFLRWKKHFRCGVLDPRYRKVREFLVGIYVKALSEWGLDGLKLDFIDEWKQESDNAPYNPNMDIPVLTDAVDAFMTEVINALQSIKPDILIEFRQNYIGPNMRKYGNMFRVIDCPYDYTKNRVGVLDLRMQMKNSAVHSDMLMWNEDISPERAAIQIINVMFGVLQYSARLEHMTEEHIAMSKFWLAFLKKHSELLLKGELTVYDAQFLYTWAKSVKDKECAVGVFANEKCVQPDCTDTIYIANGTVSERVPVDVVGDYLVTLMDCFGNEISKEQMHFSGIKAVSIPIGGLAVFKK